MACSLQTACIVTPYDLAIIRKAKRSPQIQCNVPFDCSWHFLVHRIGMNSQNHHSPFHPHHFSTSCHLVPFHPLLLSKSLNNLPFFQSFPHFSISLSIVLMTFPALSFDGHSLNTVLDPSKRGSGRTTGGPTPPSPSVLSTYVQIGRRVENSWAVS